jgi:predicted CopG family antitoxin
MPVKTVTLTVDAYDALASAKLEGESFSEVVRRLVGPRVRLSDYAGAWKGVPPRTLKEVRSYLALSDEKSKAKLRGLARGD